jgi:NitT/TauT family transport system substrate-binding protein
MKSTRCFVVVFAALVAAGVPARTVIAADKVSVSLGATDDPVYLPNFIAIDKGYYQDLGLDVEIIYAGGGIATPALMSGTLEFSTSTGSAVSAILKGAALKVIMTLSETVPWKLWSTQPEIRALGDLQGKAVGVQTRGDLFELSMRAALMKRGLSGDFVSYSPLGFGSTQRLALIQSAALPAVLLTNLEEKIARDKGSLDHAHLLIDMEQDVRIPNNGLAITNKMSTTNPSLVERFVRGTLMGVRYMKSRPEGALRIFARRVPNVPLDLLRSSVEEAAAAMLPDGTTARPVQEAEIALRGAMLGLSQMPGPDTIFDYSPVLAAAKRLQSAHWMPTE